MGAISGSREPSQSALSRPVGFDPERMFLSVDCTGDETLWVFRYASYFKSVSGCDLGEAIVHANAAWESWGTDPDCTPEDVASSDYAIASGTRSAETNEDLAQSEGCQSGPKGIARKASPETPHGIR